MIAALQTYVVWEALWAAGVIVGAVLFAFTLGKHAMVPLLTALGMSGVVATLVPFVDRVPYLANFAPHEERVIGFFIVSAVAFLVFRKNRFFEPCVVPSGWEQIVLGIIFGGFTLAIIGSFLPADVAASMTPNVRIVFVDELARAMWLVSPLAALTVLRGGVD